MANNSLSTWMRQAAFWWHCYFLKRPKQVHRARRAPRRHVRMWVDAAGKSRMLAAVLADGSEVKYCRSVAPEEWWQLLLLREDNQITCQEGLSVMLGSWTFRHALRDTVLTLFVDNAGIVGSLLRGSSKNIEVNQMVGRWWWEMMDMNCGVRILKVHTDANVADGPTRSNVSILKRLGAVEVQPLFPDWLGQLWSVPDFCGRVE